MATIRDVARLARVSPSTVSRVLSAKAPVSEERTRRVQEAVRKLQYRPSYVAQVLKNGTTGNIGLILPDISNRIFAEMARGVQDAALRLHYSVIIFNSDDNTAIERMCVETLVKKWVDGVLFSGVAGTHPGTDLELLKRAKIPTVIIDRHVKDANVPAVYLDNTQAGYDATQHLLSLGHTRIGFISGPSALALSRERLAGYRRALSQAGIAYDPRLVAAGDFRMESGFKATGRLLALDPPPTAIFASNDLMAIGCMRAARSAGLRVPADLSIIGFDGILEGSLLEVPLTTMVQPAYELGRQGMAILARQVSGEATDPAEQVVLNAHLVQRASTASPRAASKVS